MRRQLKQAFIFAAFSLIAIALSSIHPPVVNAGCNEWNYWSTCTTCCVGTTYCNDLGEREECPSGEQYWAVGRTCVDDLCGGGYGPNLMESWSYCCTDGSSPPCPDCGGNGDCFTPGTEIKTPEGEKPIESIDVGEQISSFDPKTSQSSASSVQETFQYDKQGYYQIKLEGGQELKATENHPLYSIKAVLKSLTFLEYLKTESLTSQLFDTIFK